MAENRDWMYKRFLSDGSFNPDFVNGLENFIHFSSTQPSFMDKERIKCPCKKCDNIPYRDIEVVRYHISKNGFVKNYQIWRYQGETSNPIGENSEMDIDDHTSSSSFHTMVTDHGGPRFNVDQNEELPNHEAQRLYDMLNAADRELWPGCEKHSQLSLALRLMSLKAENHMSERCYNHLTQLMQEIVPDDNLIPDNFYSSKKLLDGVGLTVEKIDCCPNNCMIYWEDDSSLSSCKFCNTSRYEVNGNDSRGCKKKKTAAAKMYYFPLTPRLQRLYASKATAKDMRWKIALHQRMSSVITQSFKRIANPTGFSWKLTLQSVKLQFFDEFRKRFSWPPSWEDDVYRMWESRARIRYRDYIHDMKVLRTAGDLGRPDYCSEEMWTGLCQYWDSPEAQRRSEAARASRMSEPDGPGSGISKHRGGSKSVEILAQEMAAKEGIPAEKCIYSSFKSIHTKKDGTFLTQKAGKINAQVMEIAAERGPDADLSEIYLDVMGRHLDKKKRMFGTGTLGLSLLSDGSSGSNADTTHLHSQQCDERYSQIQRELDLERERRQRLQEEMQAERESRQRLEEQVQATHQMMQEFLRHQSGGAAGGTGFPPPSGPS
ncbi:hypothetical protein OROMI_021098 [Orobanche minor]